LVCYLSRIDLLDIFFYVFASKKFIYLCDLKQDSPEVHANAAEILSAVTRCAPPALAAKICSPSFVGRLFRHALEESRPKSVLVHSLSVCISLLDPKRLASASYQAFRSNLSHGTLVTASPETVDGMLESLGECSLIDPVKLLMLFVCFALVTLMFSTKYILFICAR